MQQYLTIWDLVLTPIYLIILIVIAKRIRNKNHPEGDPLHKYYLPGLYVRFGGAVFIGLIYQFYYGGGDTFLYFEYAKIVNSSFDDSVITWLKLLSRTSPEVDPYLYKYASSIEYYNDPPTYTVVVITALLGLLTFNTYLPTALLFAFIAYTGIWAMYRTFCKAFPNRYKALAIAFLFVPSVFVWGSPIFKDTVCMFGLGWMTYTSFRIFVDKDFSIKNILLLILSFYLIGIIKVYILLAFLPSLFLWLLLMYSHKIRSIALRIIIGLGIGGIVVIGFIYFANSFSANLNRYSLDAITATAETTRSWIASSGDEGATYDLGAFDPSIVGVATKLPAGIAVTLFRPFLWEVKKPIQLLSSLEGLAFIILTLMTFYRNGVFGTFRLILANPNLIFFFTFSMIFAFAVGLSTGNFGTLSRYKIPCMPFFAALLIILYFSKQKRLKQKQVNPSSSDQVLTNNASYLH